jgi:hypothetical protein
LLSDLRYYPTSGTTVLTFLLWTIGEGVAILATRHLANCGVNVEAYAPPSKYLGGVELESAYICEANDTFSVHAHCRIGGSHQGSRDILGAVVGNKPVIVFVTADGRFGASVGNAGQRLGEFERATSRGPNHRARRAAEAKGRRDRQ